MMLASAIPYDGLAGAWVLGWVAQAVLYGTVLAGLTWLLIRTVFRRSTPAIHCALWMVVLLKFILPIGPAWSWSLSNVIGDWRPVWSAADAAPKAVSGPQLVECVLIPVTAGGFSASVANMPPAPVTPAATTTTFWHPLNLVAGAYLLAVVLVGLRRIIAYVRFAWLCRKLPGADSSIVATVAEVCGRLRVKRVPDVRISDAAMAPFVLGFLRPKLVLSTRHLDRPEALEAVIWHEVAHLRRGDLLVRYVQWLAGTLLFFWPVVAWVNRRIDLAREFACDEWALRHSRISAGEYARLLLRAMQPARSVRSAYQPSAMAAHSVHVERRIEMILDAKFVRKARRGLASPALVLVGGWSALVLTSALRPAEVVTEERAGEEISVPTLFDLPGWLQSAYEQQIAPVESQCGTMVQWQVAEPFVDGSFEIQLDSADHPELPLLLAHRAMLANQRQTLTFDQPLRIQLALQRPDVSIAFQPDAANDAVGVWQVADSCVAVPGVPMPPQIAIACEGGEWQGGGELEMMTVVTDENGAVDDAAPQTFVMHRVAFGSDADLEKFRQEHITADADGDGTLTPVERDAYLVALAMYDPKGVLAKFPNADRDTDGKLAAVEAARLVQGGPMMNFTAGKRISVAAPKDADGPQMLWVRAGDTGPEPIFTSMNCESKTVEVEATQDDAGQPRIVRMVVNGKEVDPENAGGDIEIRIGDEADAPAGCNVVKRIETVDADGSKQVQVLRQIVTADGNGPTAAFIAGTHAAAMPKCVPLAAPGEAAAWLLENVKLNPKIGEVAKYIPAVEDAPLATFLELNPDADQNHDGRLTAEERDAFSDRQMSSMRVRVLEKHPDADVNGDGLLTAEEMHNYFKSQAFKAAPAGAQRRIMIQRSGHADGQVEVEVNSGDDEPR